MSEPENFLSRWSRRKLEPEQAQRDEGVSARELETGEPKTDAEEPVKTESAADRQAEGSRSNEPGFDLTKLPSLESITAETDVRVFLQKGVPAELSRAALRRAWSADPAIRDFIGIAENQYDFATGKDLPGFGDLDISADELRRLVAEVFGEKLPEPELPPAPSAAAQAPAPMDDLQVDEGQQTVADAADREEQSPAGTDAIAAPEVSPQCNNADTASQQSIPEPEPDLFAARRPHGRALPQ
jgi:hypothetical protein